MKEAVRPTSGCKLFRSASVPWLRSPLSLPRICRGSGTSLAIGKTPQFSAVSASGLYALPGSSAGFGPGTHTWGYLLVAWSVLLTVLALIAVAACVMSRHGHRRGLHGLLLCVGVVSLVLIALVVPEFTAKVQTDLASFVGFSWSAIVGLGLAVLAALGAWFASATLTFPHLSGVELSLRLNPDDPLTRSF
jgi:hypothetical protein